jgi:hypothetical protein
MVRSFLKRSRNCAGRHESLLFACLLMGSFEKNFLMFVGSGIVVVTCHKQNWHCQLIRTCHDVVFF